MSISLCVITSCEDADKNPLVVSDVAPFVKYESFANRIDLAEDTPTISGRFFTNEPELIESHELLIAINNDANTPTYFPLTTITELPFNFSLTLEEIASALGIEVASIFPGDQILIQGITTSTTGVVLRNENVTVNGETVSVAQQQGYFLSNPVVCAFVYDDIPVGTYNVVTSAFGVFFEDTTTTRTVELGPGPDQVTIVEGEFPNEGSDPLILTLDPNNGEILAVNEDGQAFGTGSVSVANEFPINTYLLGAEPGSVLSCVGLFTINLNFSPFSGNEHVFILRAQ